SRFCVRCCGVVPPASEWRHDDASGLEYQQCRLWKSSGLYCRHFFLSHQQQVMDSQGCIGNTCGANSNRNTNHIIVGRRRELVICTLPSWALLVSPLLLFPCLSLLSLLVLQ